MSQENGDHTEAGMAMDLDGLLTKLTQSLSVRREMDEPCFAIARRLSDGFTDVQRLSLGIHLLASTPRCHFKDDAPPVVHALILGAREAMTIAMADSGAPIAEAVVRAMDEDEEHYANEGADAEVEEPVA